MGQFGPKIAQMAAQSLPSPCQSKVSHRKFEENNFMSNEINVLVIEDEAPIRRFLRASLPSHGYHLIEADNGEDGLLLSLIHI